jgi:hypothetical protein
VLKFFKLSNQYTIYNCPYHNFDKAIKGDKLALNKSGLKIKTLCDYALNKIICDKIDLFGLEKDYIRTQTNEAEKLILELQYLTNSKPTAKTRLNELLIRLEKENTKHIDKSSGITETDLIAMLSEYYNTPINPLKITVYEVFTSIKNIQNANERAKRNKNKM